MALESFSGIWSLDVSNPAGSDDVNQGDDHLRGIKQSIRQSFPNISATINVAASEINHLSGAASNIQNALDAHTASIDAISASLQAEIELTRVGYGGLVISSGATPIFSSSVSLSAYTLWDAGMPTSGVTVTTADGSLSPDVTGVYAVQVQYSFSGDASTEYTATLYQDDVASNFSFKRALGTGSDEGSAGFVGLVSANAGSVLKVRIGSDNADSDFIATFGQFVIERVSS